MSKRRGPSDTCLSSDIDMDEASFSHDHLLSGPPSEGEGRDDAYSLPIFGSSGDLHDGDWDVKRHLTGRRQRAVGRAKGPREAGDEWRYGEDWLRVLATTERCDHQFSILLLSLIIMRLSALFRSVRPRLTKAHPIRGMLGRTGQDRCSTPATSTTGDDASKPRIVRERSPLVRQGPGAGKQADFWLGVQVPQPKHRATVSC